MDKHGDATKIERANPYPFCISKLINKFLDVLTDDLAAILTPNRDLNHKIGVHQGSTTPIKTPYRLNQKKLEEFKKQINDLMKGGYIRSSHFMVFPCCSWVKRTGN
jgi:hypothetical protein